MQLEFYKYQGTGNDFIILDGWENQFELSTSTISNLCDRRFGVGADGLMIIKKHLHYDFEMLYFNADGLAGSMCGNGGRCLVQFAYNRGYIGVQSNFIATDGEHNAIIDLNRNWISLQMGDVDEVKLREGGDCFVNTGSPHIVRWVNNADKVDVVAEGKFIRNSIEFKQYGTNVNFVEVVNSKMFVRTFERGVEDETLSCGTGVTASVLATAATNKINNNISGCKVITLGGELFVKFERKEKAFVNIWLEGPAKFVFKGFIDIL